MPITPWKLASFSPLILLACAKPSRPSHSTLKFCQAIATNFLRLLVLPWTPPSISIIS
jgi:hypothetical protein